VSRDLLSDTCVELVTHSQTCVNLGFVARVHHLKVATVIVVLSISPVTRSHKNAQNTQINLNKQKLGEPYVYLKSVEQTLYSATVPIKKRMSPVTRSQICVNLGSVALVDLIKVPL